MIEILIVDDHAMVREGLRLIIERESDIRIVGETGCGAETIEFLRRRTVGIVVLDIVLPDRNGIEVLKEIRRDFKDISVLMLSMHAEDRFGVRSIQAGASGYISKGSAAEDLVKAVRMIYKGAKYIPQGLAEALAAEVHYERGLEEHERLSDREFEIMLLMGSGKTRAEIAKRLNLSPATVSTYRRRVLSKMNLMTNAELMRYVMENHLLE
ncbi:MAG: response regulator transcription factor [Bacteroidetes bacterium]|jgi:DNA-binding NarL/FixJ family response regulator|nr:response regulator transcription factor [Bacteroidota bacterium]